MILLRYAADVFTKYTDYAAQIEETYKEEMRRNYEEHY